MTSTLSGLGTAIRTGLSAIASERPSKPIKFLANYLNNYEEPIIINDEVGNKLESSRKNYFKYHIVEYLNKNSFSSNQQLKTLHHTPIHKNLLKKNLNSNKAFSLKNHHLLKKYSYTLLKHKMNKPHLPTRYRNQNPFKMEKKKSPKKKPSHPKMKRKHREIEKIP